jgi:hypothetical protein
MVAGQLVNVKHYKKTKYVKRIFLHKVNDCNFVCVEKGYEDSYKHGLHIGVTSWRYCES